MKKIIPVFSLFFIILSCKTYNTSILENGDLLFVPAADSGLSGAINNVTQTEKKTSYDHVGIVKKEDHRLYVLHASPRGGSQKQKLHAFLKEQTKSGQKIDIYRLKSEFHSSIPKSVSEAENLIGKPYNFNYILDENSYYCSDFVERAFRDNQIFQLEPMTFIDPKTNRTNVFWEKFYQDKNIKVPEGEPGCNPNGLANSDKIDKIGEL
ncbi:YiiX/YebB-like N1pC/P60 family cysteine hydrolase [Epilithonimonas mollis]|uniref:Permuted papain-like amidase enzyme, YaeF/YiiX, C92 family n=1 Tax=Epilithonimonas mollis TaxID=216903 RepID=A0A1M6SA82_9FLAO|nr:YiiX/YebB-like N1pC/P60 family cysteine hydrolase [Epilithonimonas mollis]SHK41621.1 Permuted papain-like amidase enzyme, YaeF/YiiX, C92 family [Epilithonimonas mollis]